MLWMVIMVMAIIQVWIMAMVDSQKNRSLGSSILAGSQPDQ